jgi:hypothetical protein
MGKLLKADPDLRERLEQQGFKAKNGTFLSKKMR